MNLRLILIVGVMMASLCFLNSCKLTNLDFSDKKSPIGNLPLVAKCEQLHLYLYADTTSTNEFPDLFISEGKYPLYIRQNTSNGIVAKHFEKDKDMLETDYDKSGHMFRNVVEYYDGYKPKLTYIDTNGDGMFDVLIIGFKNRTVYMRSNLCWEPFVHAAVTNQ